MDDTEVRALFRQAIAHDDEIAMRRGIELLLRPGDGAGRRRSTSTRFGTSVRHWKSADRWWHLETVTGHHGRFVLEQARVFDARPEQVFGMLTEPKELAKWWGPHGFTTPEIRIDLRAGGSLHFTMQPPDGEAFHLSGEFVEIQHPSRLRFTFRWDEPDPDDRETVVELSLDSLDGRTTLTLTQGEFATEERLELHRSGWTDSFEKLDAVLNARGA